MVTTWLVTNPVLRSVVDSQPAYEVVGVPIGRDAKHARYWNFGDLRLYKESPATKTREAEWETVCVEAEEWLEQTQTFSKSSSGVEKKLAVWLTDVLPGVLEVLEKREVNRRREEVRTAPNRTPPRGLLYLPDLNVVLLSVSATVLLRRFLSTLCGFPRCDVWVIK
jgi:hypothetical protein